MDGQLLQRVSFFEDFTDEQLKLIAPLILVCHFPANHPIFEQGDNADYLYILLKGEVLVRYKPYDGPPLTVARILNNGLFGWSSVIGRPIYTSGAFSVQECEAYRISGQELHHLCSKYPQTGVIIIERLADIVAERLCTMHNHIRSLLSEGIHPKRRFTKRQK